MTSRNRAMIVTVVVFVAILYMGIYMVNNDYDSYRFVLGSGKYGSNRDMNSRDIIAIAFVFGSVMIYAFLSTGKKK